MISELINEIQLEQSMSTSAVILSLAQEYDKYFMFNDEQDMVFQESKKDSDKSFTERMSDRAAGDSNKFFSFIAFVPRLIIEMFNSIIKFFKGGDTSRALKDSPHEGKFTKKTRVKKLNKAFEGSCEFYYDEKHNKIKVKDPGSQFIKDLFLICAIVAALCKLESAIKKIANASTSSDIVKFFDDITIIFSGGNLGETKLQNKYNIAKDGVSALGELIDEITVSTVILQVLSDSIKRITEKILKKEIMNGEPESKKKELLEKSKNLLTRIGAITGKINKVLVPLAAAKKVVKFGSDVLNSMCEKEDTDEEIVRRIFSMYMSDIDDDPAKGGIGIAKKRPQASGESDEDYQAALYKIFKTVLYDNSKTPAQLYNSPETFGFKNQILLKNGVLNKYYDKTKKDLLEERKNDAKLARDQRKQDAMNRQLRD